MIVFLVAATDGVGLADAMGRGWTRIAYNRFVTADKTDVRVIRRFADFHPAADTTRMVAGSDYEGGPSTDGVPPGEAERQMDLWLKEKAAFDEFVASGRGEWVVP